MPAALLQADKSFQIQDTESIAPAEGQVRLEVAFCGVCGTDLHIFKGHMDRRVAFPEVIGHEASATVAEVGPGVTSVEPGDAVVVRPLDACGDCAACRKGFGHVCTNLNFIGIDSPGAFQGSWTVPAGLVHELPGGLDLKMAAFVEPLAVACHDVRMAGLRAGEAAVVLGGGPIGMLIAMVARATGAEVILSEVNPKRLELARTLGVAGVNPVSEDVPAFVKEHNGGELADVVFEVSGAAPAIAQMTHLACVRGRVVVVAIVPEPAKVDLFQVFWKELKIIGTRVYEPQDYDRAIAMLADGSIDPSPLVTGEYPLTRVDEAFDSLSNSPDHMKILIDCRG
ncbi:zinc-dependent alcohol dehydrogenase [Phycisphaera mikurensis]|uniref:Putative zinc-containing alcohol dehydrogenase n=1 Tax=Phycisphaera mikurensis (strain NBRC 102666 / KCTC 22515 / FYK2301M01) TaxID=1142394 RepID=I0IHH1_PHYMF|nr:alcohol dehydrogenase catalytic domain-containing protein [Phycisphaera mikurensis]MBB6440956.1 2-desacetyl-2-hydroxyethyl bacteriochlorophyllide A dehydrogenase [Phycisphaera mikurensis]BAM04709.1 putative zinc-containing alcohol dehydrogenase [Phycisphaera mikurensis NBRC 102666]